MMKTLLKILVILMLILEGVNSQAQTEKEKEKVTEKETKKKPPPELSEKVYNKVAPAVVKIECDNGNKIGSGTIVGLTENGRAIILTACHVVAIDFEYTPAEIPVQFYDDVVVRLATDTLTVRSCEVLDSQHREKDLVLIATREPVPAKNLVINYNRSKHAGPGTLVAAMGFPDSDKLSQTVGNIKRVEGGFIIFDANIAPGSSGGPLIDKFGRMVGVSRSTFEGEGYAVPSDTVLSIVGGWLQKILLKRLWLYQKYGNFWEMMRKDVRFNAGEFALVVAISVYIYLESIPPDLPTPPDPPPLR